jgi:predicted ATP-grasp superfamily ATP-dependent carboligase
MPTGLAWGKGIIYAHENLRVGDTHSWAVQDIADIPHPGEQIPLGAPVCTIFARGQDAISCWAAVLDRASRWSPVVSG